MQEKLVDFAKKGEGCCPDIDGKTRFIGFIVSIIIGVILCILSIGSVIGIIFGTFGEGSSAPVWSVILLTCGNVVCIGSTFFLYGPKKQFSKMIEPVRVVASLILVVAFILSIVCAICFPRESWLITTVVLVQLAALVWYVFSYIPFAQDCLTKCTKQVCCSCCIKGEAEGSTVA